MSEVMINGIVFKGDLGDIQHLKAVKKDNDRTDLLTDAMVARAEGRSLNKFQEARLAEWDYEQGAMLAEIREMDEVESVDLKAETDSLLCKYRGVHYLLPEHRGKLVKRLRAEIQAHYDNRRN
jgi:hypothetical protein